MFFRQCFLVSATLFLLFSTSSGQEGKSCATPDNTPGTCINIKSCKILVDLLVGKNTRDDPDVRSYLRRSTCGYQGNTPMVCCPQQVRRNNDVTDDSNNTNNNNNNEQNVNRDNFLRPPACGFSKVPFPKVVGGIPAILGEFPWLVALGYRNQNNPNMPKWLCGGTLITNRHILTAAHCVHNRKDLYMARVGDLDLYSDTDGASPEDILLERAKIHENYSPVQFTNDIAILKLSRPVNNPTVTPICLPVDEPQRSNTFLKYDGYVAGWGAIYFRGPSSSVLQLAALPIIDNERCKTAYANKSVIDDRIICAGYATGGKDACQGDSGGPLMYGKSQSDHNDFYQIGVVSYGFKCAEAGYPGVYTRLTNFIDWIGRNLD